MSIEAGFQQKNFQPHKERIPVCPSYRIIEICVLLAGASPEQLADAPDFCGEWVEHYDNTRLLSGSEGYRHDARAACRATLVLLKHMIGSVGDKIDLQSVGQVDFAIRKAKSIREKKAIIDAAVDAQNKHKRRKEILERWRQVIYDTCIVPKNPGVAPKHFRQIASPGDLSEGEILSKVIQFMKVLDNIVGDTPSSYAVEWKAAENCPQSPVSRDVVLGRS